MLEEYIEEEQRFDMLLQWYRHLVVVHANERQILDVAGVCKLEMNLVFALGLIEFATGQEVKKAVHCQKDG